MKKKALNYFLFFINIVFCTCITIKADLIDYSGGNAGSSGSIGSGSWLSKYVGVKVSIVSASNSVEDVEIFVNENGKAGKFSYENLPKTKQSYDITWVDSSKRTVYKNTNLPKKWLNSEDKNINLYSYLAKDKYKLLIELIETKGAFKTLSPGDYILVEPMVYIGGYYGTGFELGRAFFKLDKCGSKGSFCWTYGRRIFGGSASNTSGGLFFTTLYVDTAISNIGIYNMSKWLDKNPEVKTGDKYKDRHKCIMAKSCGRGIGVFKYDDIYSGSLKIVKQDSKTKAKLSGAGFTLYSDSSCSKKIKNEQITNSNGEAFFNNLATGNYYYKETKVPNGYTGDYNCRLAAVTNNKTTKVTINNTKNISDGNLTIYIKKYINGNKTNELIQNPESQATYNIYKGSNCSGTIIKTVKTSSGYVPGINLEVGTYSIGETINPPGTPKDYTIAPPGYSSEKTKCVKSSVSITANSAQNESIFYRASCEKRLQESDKSPASLIKLFEEFGRRGLLDFSEGGKNATCNDVTCPNTSSPNLNIGCLSGSLNTSSINKTPITEQNLSCYSDKITKPTGEILGFCADTFNLTNNLNETNFYSTSGQFIIRKNINNKIQFYKNENELIEIDNPYVATANVGKTCYMLNGNVPPQEKTQRPSLKVYFGNNNPDDDDVVKVDELPYIKNSSSTSEYVNNGFVRYNYTDTYNYNLNTVYLERLTGKVVNKKNGVVEEVGLVIPFKPVKAEEKYIPFKVSYNNQNFSSNACKYEYELEIIKYPPDKKNGKMDLEFRLINLKTPFLNERGEVRSTNSNWCDYSASKEEQCDANNGVVVENIINAPNSYGQNSTKPIYTITLTSSDIKVIREYNKENSYDNYELYCENEPETGETLCSNLFIKDLKNRVLNKYENGTQIKTYGNLTTGLIIP